MNEIREDLKAFVDGELSPERSAEVQAAIDSDPALKQEVEYMKMLGFEIKKLAEEPAVVGKEEAVSKFKRAPLPWWNPATLSGRFAYAGALFVVLLGLGSVMFPVFAQSKQSEKAVAANATASESLRWQDGGASAADQAPAEAESPAPGSPPITGHRYRANGAVGGEDERAPSDSTLALKGRFGMSKESGKTETLPAIPSGDEGVGVAGGLAPRRPSEGRASSPVKKKDMGISSHTKQDIAGNALAEFPASRRMVIKNAEITVRVADAKKAMTQAEGLAKALGGYAEGSSLELAPDQTPRASIVLRVPARSYESAMARLRDMGDVPFETSNAQDVTAEYADLDGRLRVLHAEEDSYVTMLRAAKKVGELMEIKDRLSQVRQEIASMESQRKALANESALSTISATFEQKASTDKPKKTEPSGWDESWAKAVNGLSKVGEFLGNAVIYIFVFSPIWLPPMILFWWLGKRARV